MKEDSVVDLDPPYFCHLDSDSGFERVYRRYLRFQPHSEEILQNMYGTIPVGRYLPT